MKLLIAGALIVLLIAQARGKEITRQNNGTFATKPAGENKQVGTTSATRDACYGGLGPFSNAAPYNNAKVPQCRTNVGTEFYVYDATNGTTIVKPDNVASYASLFPNNKDMKIIIHGWTRSCEVYWVNEMVAEYRKKNAYTIICANWKKGASYLFDYNQAAGNTRLVAAEIVQMLNTVGIDPSRVHLIGHSLGAHTAGHAGQKLRGIGRITGNVSRPKSEMLLTRTLTGLDPSEHKFQGMDPRVRLDSTDADFVDVIHTDTSSFSYIYGYGLEQAIGHIDFYPNGGVTQPGCNTLIVGCHHSRAHTYFVESINSACRFTGYSCTDSEHWHAGSCTSCGASGCPVMGEPIDKSNRGIYYLSTRGSSSHCASDYRVDIVVGSDFNSSAGDLTMTLTGSSGSDSTFVNYMQQKFLASMRHVFMVGLNNVGVVQKVRLQWTRSNGKNMTVDQFEVFDIKNSQRYKSCASLLIASETSSEMPLGC